MFNFESNIFSGVSYLCQSSFGTTQETFSKILEKARSLFLPLFWFFRTVPGSTCFSIFPMFWTGDVLGFFFLNLSFKWWLSWVQKSLWKNRINLGLKKMKVFYSISFFVWLRILIFKLILNEILFLLFSLFSHSLVVLAWPSGPQTRPGLIWQIVGPATEGYYRSSHLVCCLSFRSLPDRLLKSFVNGLSQVVVCSSFFQLSFMGPGPSIWALDK